MNQLTLTLEEGEDGNDSRGRDVDGELVLPDGDLLDILGQAAHDPRAVFVEVIGLGAVLVGRVDERSLEGANVLARRLPQVFGILGIAGREAGQLRD